MNPLLGIAIKDVKTFFREKGIIFWTIAFPLLMMFLFSAIFGRGSPFTASVGIVDFDQTEITRSLIKVFKETEIFDVKIFENQQKAMDKLRAGDVRAVLIFPKGFQLNITTGKKTHADFYVDETRLGTAQTVRSGIQAIFAEFNRQIRLKWVRQYSEQLRDIRRPFCRGVLLTPFCSQAWLEQRAPS